LSRTDAHSPLWIRLARRELASEAAHAAAHAACDLPDYPSLTRPAWLPATKCHWVLHYTGTNVCSCWMCHAGRQHRQENRAQRRRDHVALHIAVGRWRHGDESAFDDLAPPARSYHW